MRLKRKDHQPVRIFLTSVLVSLTLLLHAEDGNSQYIEFLSIPDTVGYPGDSVFVQTVIAAEGPTVLFSMEGMVQDHVELSSYDFENSVFDTTLWEYYIELDSNYFEAIFVPDSSDFLIPGNGVALNLVIVIPTGLSPCEAAASVYMALIVDTLGLGWIDTARGILEILELPWERGDINHDSVIDYIDLEMLRAYVFEGSEIPRPIGVADINRDNYVDLIDLIELRHVIYND